MGVTTFPLRLLLSLAMYLQGFFPYLVFFVWLDKHIFLKQKTWLERAITPQSVSPKLNIYSFQGENCMCYRDFSFPNTNILINACMLNRTKQKDACDKSLANKKPEVCNNTFCNHFILTGQYLICGRKEIKLHRNTNLSQVLLKQLPSNVLQCHLFIGYLL